MDIYAIRAKTMADPLQVAARYPSQREGERRAILDLAHKLDLQPSDTLLDIGSGIGNITIPISYLVGEVWAVDHPDVLARLEQRAPGRVHCIYGDFLDLPFTEKFDKVLSYAAIHYLKDDEEVLDFVAKAVSLLNPKGCALFGDLPNEDQKARTAARIVSGMDEDWEARERALPVDTQLVRFDDVLCLELVQMCREMGYNAWLLPQPEGLCFNAREDLLVVRP